METVTIEQVMIIMSFECELAIFAKIVDVRYRGFRPPFGDKVALVRHVLKSSIGCSKAFHCV